MIQLLIIADDISTYVKEFGENYEMMEEQAEYLLSEEWEADLNDKANYISIRDDIIANVRILSNINVIYSNLSIITPNLYV